MSRTSGWIEGGSSRGRVAGSVGISGTIGCTSGRERGASCGKVISGCSWSRLLSSGTTGSLNGVDVVIGCLSNSSI